MNKSPLSKLPAEIRNSIYELVLKQKKPFILEPTIKNDQFADWRLVKDSDAHSTTLALSETCKAVNNECKHLIFAINTFVLRVGHAGGKPSAKSYDGVLEGFCLHIGQANVSALRSVIVQVECFEWWHTIEIETLAQSRMVATLPAIIAVIQKELQPQLKLATLSLKFSFACDEVYGAVLDLRELPNSWEGAMIKLEKEVKDAKTRTFSPDILDCFLLELARCQKMSTK